MRPAEYRAVCTATLIQGKITQRVSRVAAPLRRAVVLIDRASKIARAAEAPARRRDVEEQGFVVISISMYPEDLAAADSACDRMRGAGVRDISRSKLIRIALRRLDPEALAAELLGVT